MNIYSLSFIRNSYTHKYVSMILYVTFNYSTCDIVYFFKLSYYKAIINDLKLYTHITMYIHIETWRHKLLHALSRVNTWYVSCCHCVISLQNSILDMPPFKVVTSLQVLCHTQRKQIITWKSKHSHQHKHARPTFYKHLQNAQFA